MTVSSTAGTLSTIYSALVAGYNGATLSNGQTLTASGDVNAMEAVSDAMLPFLSFSSGSFTNTDWAQWSTKVTWQIPATLKVKAEIGGGAARAIRLIIGDLFQIAGLIRGLPMDQNGNLVPYSAATPHLYDQGKLTDLALRGGPFLQSARIVEVPSVPYAMADVVFGVEFITNFDPRTPKRVRVSAVGINIMDPAGTNLLADPALGALAIPNPPPAADVRGMGQYNTPDPLLLDGGHRLTPGAPFPPGGQGHVAGPLDNVKGSIISVSVVPARTSLSRLSTLQLQAIGNFNDTSTQALTSVATWGSSNAAVATVSSAGLVTGVSAGSVVITATFNGLSGTASLTLT